MLDDLEEDIERELEEGVGGAYGGGGDGEQTRATKEEIEDKKELLKLQEVISDRSVGRPSVASDNASQTQKPLNSLLPKPPVKVVKRVTRTINEEGEEVIEIKYILSEEEVRRVEAEQAQTLKERGRRRRRLTGGGDGSDEEVEMGAGGKGMVIKLDHLKSIARRTVEMHPIARH